MQKLGGVGWKFGGNCYLCRLNARGVGFFDARALRRLFLDWRWRDEDC